MRRTELLNTLRRASPALAARDFLAPLACFYFDGQNVTAYNTILALSAPCVTDAALRGGLPGKELMGVLAASGAKEVSFNPDAQEVSIKAGRTRLKLALTPLEDFAFTMPPPEEGVSLKLDEPWRDGLRRAALSLGRDMDHPWRLGITVQFEKTGANLYSSDDKTLSRATVPGAPPKALRGKAVILPPAFVEAWLTLARGDEATSLHLAETWVMARFSSGIILFGAARPEPAEPENFSSVFANLGAVEPQPIPKDFAGALDRAEVFLAAAGVEDRTRFTASGGKLKMLTRNAAGEVRDFHSWGGTDGDLLAEPALLKRALKMTDRMELINPRAFLLQGENFAHLVAASVAGAAE